MTSARTKDWQIPRLTPTYFTFGLSEKKLFRQPSLSALRDIDRGSYMSADNHHLPDIGDGDNVGFAYLYVEIDEDKFVRLR